MHERQQLDRDSGPVPQDTSTDLPAIETPLIDIQDLERKPGADTRVNNSGVKVRTQSDEQRLRDDAEFVKEVEEARDAIAEFERALAQDKRE